MAVVVLTAHYQYWGERSLRDAIRLHFRGKIEILRSDENRQITAGISRDGAIFKMPAPLVVRLVDFIGYKIKNDKIRCTDEAVYARDRNICQYWHHDERGKRYKYRCSVEDRTIDHVIPKSRGGEDTFENEVCSCRWHNVEVKKNRTPREAGMELIRKPFAPRLKKGDMAVITISFNPHSKAHQAYFEVVGGQFSHVVK
jgi:5-methylcytosine-specific restriction endonuclease McrA